MSKHDDFPIAERESCQHRAFAGRAGSDRRMLDEIKFDVRHGGQIERCAVVGDRSWESWMTKLARPIVFRAEVRYVDVAERDKAWEWINEGLPTLATA